VRNARFGLALYSVLALLPVACSQSTTTTSRTTATTAPSAPKLCDGRAAPAKYDHVVWVWMENKRFDQVIGAADAPYETQLARECATATRYVAAGAPSLANYIAATSGSVQGVGDNKAPAAHPLTVDNLFRQVRAAGGTEQTWAEAMPSNCALTSSGRYAVKHNPAAYYVGGDDRAACRRDNVPLPGSVDDLPTFLTVIPDACHQTHDCSVREGDDWLRTFLPQVFGSPAYRSGTTAVFVVWDEYTPMPFIAVSPSIRPGTVVDAPAGHPSLLHTTEELLGLPLLPGADTATSLRAPLHL